MQDFLDFIVRNWDVIGLLITNVIALFVKSPLSKE